MLWYDGILGQYLLLNNLLIVKNVSILAYSNTLSRPKDNENVLGETQILHAGCSVAEPKIVAPPQTPFPVAPSRWRRTAKIQSTGDGHYLHLQTQFGEDRTTQFLVIMVTDPQTNKQTNPQTNTHKQTGLTIHCAAKLSEQCNKNINKQAEA